MFANFISYNLRELVSQKVFQDFKTFSLATKMAWTFIRAMIVLKSKVELNFKPCKRIVYTLDKLCHKIKQCMLMHPS